jgi:hypothetical protein
LLKYSATLPRNAAVVSDDELRRRHSMRRVETQSIREVVPPFNWNSIHRKERDSLAPASNLTENLFPREGVDAFYAKTFKTPGLWRNELSPLVIILDADDVVLAEIAAGLHLDQFQRNLAGNGDDASAARACRPA